jgi:hypothetical protein
MRQDKAVRAKQAVPSSACRHLLPEGRREKLKPQRITEHDQPLAVLQ